MGKHVGTDLKIPDENNGPVVWRTDLNVLEAKEIGRLRQRVEWLQTLRGRCNRFLLDEPRSIDEEIEIINSRISVLGNSIESRSSTISWKKSCFEANRIQNEGDY